MNKVESMAVLVGAGKALRDTTGLDLGSGWLEVMLTTAPYLEGARVSANAVAHTQDGSAIGAAALYGAAKTGFFMGLGYTVGYVASQFMNK